MRRATTTAHPLAALFWSLAPEESGEFTPEDPLAQEYLAQQVGNWLFPGFTTRTNRANYYVMVLYGLMAVEEALRRAREHQGDRAFKDYFERFERFWAMSVVHSFGGEVPEGERMRGVRGVLRKYAESAAESLPLDYLLISRQIELGALGAYLTSLRHHELVERDGMRVTPRGRELGEAFFFAPDENKHYGQYDEYVQQLLVPGTTQIPARNGLITLQRMGEVGRLGRIRERSGLQDTLHRILFRETADRTTQQLGQIIVDADSQGLRSAKSVFSAVAEGHFTAEPELRELCRLACRYAELSTHLRRLFDSLYVNISGRGYLAALADVVPYWLPTQQLAELQAAARDLIDSPAATRLGTLPVHGAAFLQLTRRCCEASAHQVAELLIEYHGSVQRERGRNGGWMRLLSNKVRVELSSFSATWVEGSGWMQDFKFGAIRTLLADLGRIP